MRPRKETWAWALFSTAALDCSNLLASASRALDWLRNSANNDLRVAISPLMACALSLNARYSASLPDLNAPFICVVIFSYSVSRDARAFSFISHAAPTCASIARISSADDAAPALARCKLFNSVIKATMPCFSSSSSALAALACSIRASCAAPGCNSLIFAFNSATVFSRFWITCFCMLIDSTISCVVLSITSPLPTTALEKP